MFVLFTYFYFLIIDFFLFCCLLLLVVICVKLMRRSRRKMERLKAFFCYLVAVCLCFLSFPPPFHSFSFRSLFFLPFIISFFFHFWDPVHHSVLEEKSSKSSPGLVVELEVGVAFVVTGGAGGAFVGAESKRRSISSGLFTLGLGAAGIFVEGVSSKGFTLLTTGLEVTSLGVKTISKGSLLVEDGLDSTGDINPNKSSYKRGT